MVTVHVHDNELFATVVSFCQLFRFIKAANYTSPLSAGWHGDALWERTTGRERLQYPR